MTEGSIAGQLIRFTIPLLLGNICQQLYNIADSLIVGKLLGSHALAAVSSTSQLVLLLIGIISGVCIGAGVVISRYFGAQDDHSMHLAIHTTLAFTLTAGLFLTVFGTTMSPTLLRWMGTPPEVLPQAAKYLSIYFLGALGLVLYNACRGIMQAIGDSRHPLYYLIISSVMNVVLDIVFIAVFDWGIAGAAIATIISQFFSVFLCLRRLMRTKESYRVELRHIRFEMPMLKMIVRYGLPTGLQNSVVSLSNVVVQSNINAFGAMAMAGCGAYSRIEALVFTCILCFAMALTTFVGQNLGAEEYERARKGARFGIFCSMAMAETLGIIVILTAPWLVGAFTSDPEAIAYGVEKSRICALFYCMGAASHGFSGVLRGAGKATVPMVSMLIFWAGARIVLLSIFVPIFKTIQVVYWVYPITWVMNTVVLLIYYKKADWMHAFKEKAAKA